ncbi:hypothetical protein J19TS2_19210 [Cohnella xylanilytica]|uniref:LuxR C-terminal-related transcriptional regulator n=1 Tax=Cohnella xylanilytica TaxID=557555 RepID=UPI001B179A69|nr:LuxR C-terminal-related transcriptional regulator [Cohnella xylanilytica]GIO12366.1 hypothetical protein J19TS2_19210 [Cohnella xylanilytica]
MSQTFGDRIFRWMDDHFVGREFELEYFRQRLAQLDERDERILNVYGTAGMGKTYLLERFARIAGELGAFYVRADVRDALNRRERLLSSLLEQMEPTPSTLPISSSPSPSLSLSPPEGLPASALQLQERCLQALNRIAEGRRVVLSFDGYEEIGGLDHWLRTSFLPGLSGNVLVMISGRFPLEGPWRHTPAWRKLIVRLPLAELSYGDIRTYLRQWGVDDEKEADAVWLRTMGHPLALSLLTPDNRETANAANAPNAANPANAASASAAAAAGRLRPPNAAAAEEEDPLQALLDDWLREAPDDELRRLLFAASAVRTFHQDLLSKLMGAEVPSTLFQRLTDLSFVSRTANGWQLQELVWETVRRHFRERMPDTYAAYRDRAAEHYLAKLEEGLAQGRDIVWEFGELLRYADNPVLRAHYRHARTSRNYLEPLGEANLEEAQAYVRRRQKQEESWKVLCSDAESGELYRFELSADLGRARLNLIPLGELAKTGEESVRLLRSPEGRVVGLFAIVPVNGRTYDWLSKSPVSRAYIASLSAEERSRIRTSSSDTEIRFVYVLDVESLERDELRSDIVHALLEPILAGRLLIESPPPHDYYRLGKTSLGFEPLPGAEHADYGGDRPATTYALDTRREKLRDLLRRMVRVPGTAAAPARPNAVQGRNELTPREREVAELLVLGLTNAEIAAKIYVSEAAVKKHVNAMLSKYGLKNRTQLANHLINS